MTEEKQKLSGPSHPKVVYTYILFSLTWQIVTFLHIDLLHNLHTWLLALIVRWDLDSQLMWTY